jgi:hypothetical protein
MASLEKCKNLKAHHSFKRIKQRTALQGFLYSSHGIMPKLQRRFHIHVASFKQITEINTCSKSLSLHPCYHSVVIEHFSHISIYLSKMVETKNVYKVLVGKFVEKCSNGGSEYRKRI